VSRRDRQRLNDILAAISAICAHLARGDLSDGLVFDALAATVESDLPELERAARSLIDQSEG
jgi:uncharacterized protein with HEPN domain